MPGGAEIGDMLAATTPTQVTAWKARDGHLCATPELATLSDIADNWRDARRQADKVGDAMRNFTRASELGDKVDLDAMREAAVQVLSAARAVNELRDQLDQARKDAGVKP